MVIHHPGQRYPTRHHDHHPQHYRPDIHLHYYTTDNADNAAEERIHYIQIDKNATASNNASGSQQTTHTTQFAWLRLPWLARLNAFN